MKNPPAHARGVGWWVTELLAAFAGLGGCDLEADAQNLVCLLCGEPRQVTSFGVVPASQVQRDARSSHTSRGAAVIDDLQNGGIEHGDLLDR